MKTFLVSVCSFLLVTASFCMYSVYPEKNVGQYSEINFQIPCENEYKMFCLSGGKSFHLVDEDIVGCNCTWFYGGKPGENVCGGLRWDFKLGYFFHKIVRVLNFFFQNLT